MSAIEHRPHGGMDAQREPPMSQMGQNPPPAVRSHVRFHRVQTLAGRVARWSSSQHLVVGDPTLPARLILLLTLRASSIVAQAQPMHSEGTLIILLASRDGLVVASDGRQTVDGVFCDGVSSKLLEPAGHNRLILAVTGRRGFYPATTALASNVCDFIRHTPREFDLGEVVKNYIEGDATFDLPSVDMKKVAEHCIRTLVQYFALNPHRSPAISGDRFEFDRCLRFLRAEALALCSPYLYDRSASRWNWPRCSPWIERTYWARRFCRAGSCW